MQPDRDTAWRDRDKSQTTRNVRRRERYREQNPRSCQDCGATVSPRCQRCADCQLARTNPPRICPSAEGWSPCDEPLTDRARRCWLHQSADKDVLAARRSARRKDSYQEANNLWTR